MHDTTLRWTHALRVVAVVGFAVYAPYYLFWRLSTLNPAAPVFSWVVWGAELYGYVTAMMHFFMVRRFSNPQSVTAPTGYRVAVLIPTYNESVQLVRHTLAGAVRMDYPHETFLLDDGNRPEMAALAAELGAKYLARAERTDAKAGNLNNALRSTDAEFIAIFDADHVPARDFLTRTLGFFNDANVAFVQTPQEYYNLDSYQHRLRPDRSYLWTEQGLFFRVIQRGKDYHGGAYFCGSCAVVRRSALDAIGGFATGTVTEDLHTSLRLHKRGFRSVYYPQALAFGLAPDSARAFLVQRQRWGQGAMRVWWKESILFARGLSFAQRLNYLASVLTYFDGWQKAIFYVAPIVVLITGVMPIAKFGWTFLLYFVPFYVLCFWAFEEAGRGFGGTLRTEQYNMARFATFIWATLSGFVRGVTFRVTPKQAGHVSSWRELMPQRAVFYLSIGAILIGAWFFVTQAHLTPGAFWANVFWALVNMGLAGAVLRFSRRKQHRRAEYRFPIPLPAQFGTNGEETFGVVENISVQGCRFLCEQQLVSGSSLHGTIYTPKGRVAVRASVVRAEPPAIPRESGTASRTSRPKHSYGLQFEWTHAAASAELDAYLYGSDAQWRILELHDDLTTPAAWLVSRLSGRARAKARGLAKWVPVTVREVERQDAVPRFGVLSRTNWGHELARLILFEPLAENSPIAMDVFGNSPRDRLLGTVHTQNRIGDSVSDVFELRIAVQPNGASQKPPTTRVASVLVTSAALLLGLLIMPAPSRAVSGLVLAGAEVAEGGNRYAYLGAIVPLSRDSQLGNGWVQRIWFDWLEYRFDSGGQEILAQGPGASWMLGYQGGSNLAYGVYAGVTYRDTDLDPDDRSVSNRGRQVGAGTIAELNGSFAEKWHYGLIAALTTSPHGAYWGRFRMLRTISPRGLQVGFETVGYGDPDYSGVKVGAVLDRLSLGRQASLGVKLGANKIKALDAGAYAGLELAWVFDGR